MTLLHQALLTSLAMAGLNCAAIALQTRSESKARVLFPHSTSGGPISGETIAFRSGEDSMEKALSSLTGSGGVTRP